MEELRGHLRAHWEEIKRQLLNGTYEPQPCGGWTYPSPGEARSMLGIPTVVDRLIQQAMHQILSPVWEPEFSTHSYGFRPGRGAHQAVKAAKATSIRDTAGWWIWTWRSSLTGSTTTC